MSERRQSDYATSGRITPGNHNMAAGGYDEGGNQRKVIVAIQKTPIDPDKRSVIYREPYMTYYVYVNGGIPGDVHDRKGIVTKQYRDLQRNILVSDYLSGGLLKRKNDLSFLGVNLGLINIIVPVTVPFSNVDLVDGSISIDFKCDLRNPEKISTMFGTDYAVSNVDGNEVNVYITAEGLSYLIGNPIADGMARVSPGFDRVFDVVSDIRNALFDVLDGDVAIKEYGLNVSRASIRFSETSAETILRLQKENRIEMEKDKMKHEKNMLEIDLSRREYQEVHRNG